MTETFDYIVVGGGSAGCIVAAELSADPDVRVLLLETGDSALEHPETLVADGYKTAFANDRLVYDRFSAVDPRWGDRRLFMGSGRGLGGSGSINAMVYTRGSELDYAEWPEGWRWADVTPDFERLEARLTPHRRPPTRFTEVAITAAEQAGFRRGDDLNDGDLSGVLGYEWMNYAGEQRRSSFVAFLEPALARPNLSVRTRAVGHRVLLAEGRAAGVEYARDGELLSARATREVVLCAGSLETPKLLMLSGIGPSEVLRRAGLPVLVDVPGVGRDLHDHPNVTIFHFGKNDVDANYPQLYGFHRAHPKSHLPAGQSDTCYVFYPARSSFREAAMRMLPTLALPEALYDVDALTRSMRGALGAVLGSAPMKRVVERLYGIVVILGKPKSRGVLEVRSNRPEAPAFIDPGYFEDPADLETMVHGVELARRIADSPAFTAWGNLEVVPGRRAGSREAVKGFVRKNVMTTFHYAGTCRMGEDPASVVDTRLRFRAVPGLRVADASVIPNTPVSALNAPSMLIGLRGATYAREEAQR